MIFAIIRFFFRKLKADARPVYLPNDPTIISSAADCRLTVFESVDAAKEFWIKVGDCLLLSRQIAENALIYLQGQNFTIANLIEDQTLAAGFADGAVAIFRLAPAGKLRLLSLFNSQANVFGHLDRLVSFLCNFKKRHY